MFAALCRHMSFLSLTSAFAAAITLVGPPQPSEADDAEVRAWSAAFAAWVDVSRNIACPHLKPRIEMLTGRLQKLQDAFVARHPDYVFPPLVYAAQPFIGCDDGTPMVTRAETLAGQVENMVKQPQ
jgi:hypothetical protein